MDHERRQPKDLPRRLWAAGFWRRAAAFVIDAAIVLPLSLMLAVATGLADLASLPERRGNLLDYVVDLWNTQPEMIVKPVGLFLCLLFFYDFFMTALWATSPGRRTLQIRLWDQSGRRPALPRIVVRALVRPLSFFVFTLGCLWCAAQREGRSWHDLAAGTWAGSRHDEA